MPPQAGRAGQARDDGMFDALDCDGRAKRPTTMVRRPPSTRDPIYPEFCGSGDIFVVIASVALAEPLPTKTTDKPANACLLQAVGAGWP